MSPRTATMCCAVAAGSVLDSGGVWQMPLPSANSTSRFSPIGTPDRWSARKNALVSPASGPGSGGAAGFDDGEAGAGGSEVTACPEEIAVLEASAGSAGPADPPLTD